MPEKVLTEIKSVAHVKTVESIGENGSGGSKVTLEVHCDSVPGGVVSHTSKQIAADNRITRSTLELVDYEAIPKAPAGKEPTTNTTRRRLFKARRHN